MAKGKSPPLGKDDSHQEEEWYDILHRKNLGRGHQAKSLRSSRLPAFSSSRAKLFLPCCLPLSPRPKNTARALATMAASCSLNTALVICPRCAHASRRHFTQATVPVWPSLRDLLWETFSEHSITRLPPNYSHHNHSLNFHLAWVFSMPLSSIWKFIKMPS